MPGIGAPNTGNLTVGKGFLLFKPEGATEFYHVGNVPSFQFTPTVETLEHFSAMEGTKEKDLTIVLSKGGTVKMDMEELTANNIAMLVLGEVDTTTDPAAPTVSILSRTSIAGALRFYATNDVGPRWSADFKRVVFNPSGAFDPIGEKFAVMTVTGSLESVSGDFGTMTLLPSVNSVVPTNLLAPFIMGQFSPGSVPMTAKVGETMTAIFGAWIGYVSIAFQWKLGGVDISGADQKTYVPVAGDAGSPLTVQVTATNEAGDTVVVSAATANVTA